MVLKIYTEDILKLNELIDDNYLKLVNEITIKDLNNKEKISSIFGLTLFINDKNISITNIIENLENDSKNNINDSFNDFINAIPFEKELDENLPTYIYINRVYYNIMISDSLEIIENFIKKQSSKNVTNSDIEISIDDEDWIHLDTDF